MKAAEYIFVACLALAVLQAAMGVLLLALPIILFVSLIQNPRETIGLASLVLLAGLIHYRPVALIALVAMGVAASLIGKAIDKSRT